MRIALLQCNVRTGDFPANCEKILSLAKQAAKEKADICICPQDAIIGPEPACFANFPEFSENCQKAFSYLAHGLPSGLALLCLASGFEQEVLCSGGEWTHVPTDFFWNGHHIFIADKAREVPEQINYDFIISQKPTPFSPYRQEEEERKWQSVSERYSSMCIKANLVGGYGEIIYPGASFVTAFGQLVARASAFDEGCLLVDSNLMDNGNKLAPFPDLNKAQWLALCTGIKDYIQKSGMRKSVLGLSGGMDSALVCCLAVEALGPENVIAVMLPSRFSSTGSIDDSRALCKNLGIVPLLLPIEKIMESCIETLDPIFSQIATHKGDLTYENIQPRIRTLLLMAIANRDNALLLNTGNRSEAFMGYSTLYGDTAGAISVLGDLYKSRVYELARWYNQEKERDIIPQAILDKAPSAELRPDQKDTDSLPPYHYLDPLLEKISLGQTPEQDEKKDYQAIRQTFFRNQFKRSQSPKALRVGFASAPICPLQGDFIPFP